jgi:hypothetical protein
VAVSRRWWFISKPSLVRVARRQSGEARDVAQIVYWQYLNPIPAETDRLPREKKDAPDSHQGQWDVVVG